MKKKRKKRKKKRKKTNKRGLSVNYIHCCLQPGSLVQLAILHMNTVTVVQSGERLLVKLMMHVHSFYFLLGSDVPQI